MQKFMLNAHKDLYFVLLLHPQKQHMTIFSNSLLKVFSISLVRTSSHSGGVPEHNGSVSIVVIQGHIDYMSSHIMLIRATQLHAKIWDVWEGIRQSA